MKWFGVLLLATAVLGASQNPDENEGISDPNLFEGDMKLSQEQIRLAKAGEDIDSSNKRGSSSALLKQWPNGIVHYVIDSSLSRNSRAVAAINAGMEEWTTKTCIRFQRRTIEPAYIKFVRGSGCTSFVGRTGGPQDINLAQECWLRGIVAHEIGHAIGFYHEQSRPDRDNYIIVLDQNIRDDAKLNFQKYSRSRIDSLNTKYDYGSLMHYGSRAFTKNGLPTIQVRPPSGTPGGPIGQRQGLSAIDAQQADLLYKAQCDRRVAGDLKCYVCNENKGMNCSKSNLENNKDTMLFGCPASLDRCFRSWLVKDGTTTIENGCTDQDGCDLKEKHCEKLENDFDYECAIGCCDTDACNACSAVFISVFLMSVSSVLGLALKI